LELVVCHCFKTGIGNVWSRTKLKRLYNTDFERFIISRLVTERTLILYLILDHAVAGWC
jgi:hypothetical protein